jgi:hypothetical protein
VLNPSGVEQHRAAPDAWKVTHDLIVIELFARQLNAIEQLSKLGDIPLSISDLEKASADRLVRPDLKRFIKRATGGANAQIGINDEQRLAQGLHNGMGIIRLVHCGRYFRHCRRPLGAWLVAHGGAKLTSSEASVFRSSSLSGQMDVMTARGSAGIADPKGPSSSLGPGFHTLCLIAAKKRQDRAAIGRVQSRLGVGHNIPPEADPSLDGPQATFSVHL